jgi:phage terminase small subunit
MMSALLNSKHEFFAMNLASGMSATDAYEAAGYGKRDRKYAARLRQREDISRRLAEILAEREAMHAQATAIAVEKAGLTKAWAIEKMRENALVALGEKKIKLTVLPKGQATTIDVEVTGHNPQAATRALELLGREVNAFVEKKEVGGPGDFDNMSSEELLEIILRETAEISKGMH